MKEESLYNVAIYGVSEDNKILHIAKATQPLQEAKDIVENQSIDIFQECENYSKIGKTLASISKVI